MSTPAEIVSKAVSKLLIRHPFYGKVIMSSPLEQRDDIPTMATDGSSIFWSEKFVTNELQSKPEWVMFVLAHEVEHIVRMHCLRRGSRDPMLWNMAADHLINLDLMRAGLKGPVDDQGRFMGLADHKYADTNKWSSELVYRDLEQNNDDDDGGGGQGEGDDSDQSGEGNGQGKGPGGGQSKTPAGADNVFDGDVLEPRKPDGSKLSEQERADLDREVRGRVLSAAAQAKAQHGIGSIPAHLRGILVELTQSKVDWRVELREFLTARCNDDYSWARLNRRVQHRGLKLPSLDSEAVGGIAVMLDTSGSCWSAIPAFMSEVAAIAADVMPAQIRVIFVDTRVQADVLTDAENFESDMGELLRSPPRGGGTDLRPAFAAIEADPEDYDAVICLTDLWTPWPAAFEMGDSTLFVDTDCGSEQPPFGRKVNYDC